MESLAFVYRLALTVGILVTMVTGASSNPTPPSTRSSSATGLVLRDVRRYQKAAAFMRFNLAIRKYPDMETQLQDDRLCEAFQLVKVHHERIHNTLFAAYSNGKGHVVVAFRGTVKKSLKNWKTDSQFLKAKCQLGNYQERRCGRVHRGFQKAYLAIREPLKQTIRGAKRISFTGHSLGGALALLATYDFKTTFRTPTQRYPVNNCYVFGTPLVADLRWEMLFSHLKLDSLRFSQKDGNRTDVIPRISRYFSMV